MRNVTIFGTLTILGLMLWCAGMITPALAQATETFTPSPTANFVLPLINVPIQLPTSFIPPAPTLISVNVTPGVNMNPHGFDMPNPMAFWMDEANYLQAVVAITGWMGNLFWLAFILYVFIALFKRIYSRVMGRSEAVREERQAEKESGRKTARFLR